MRFARISRDVIVSFRIILL